MARNSHMLQSVTGESLARARRIIVKIGSALLVDETTAIFIASGSKR